MVFLMIPQIDDPIVFHIFNRQILFAQRNDSSLFQNTVLSTFTGQILSKPFHPIPWEFFRPKKGMFPCLIWDSTRKDLTFVACEQQVCRPACAFAQSDQRLCYLQSSKYSGRTCFMQDYNVLTSLSRWTG